MKKLFLTEEDITKLVRKSIKNKLFSNISEGSADMDKNGVLTPEELHRHFDTDGDGVVTMVDYATHVDFHCDNPELLDDYRDTEEYKEKISQQREEFVEFFGKNSKDIVTENKSFDIDNISFELSDDDVENLLSHDGPVRRFRGSIYYDAVVPETDDKEYDRKIAEAILNHERKKMFNQETYVGGVGFKQKSLIDPFDKMDF